MGPDRDLHSSVQAQSHPGAGGGGGGGGRGEGGWVGRGSLVKLTRKISDRGRVKDVAKRGEHSYTKPMPVQGIPCTLILSEYQQIVDRKIGKVSSWTCCKASAHFLFSLTASEGLQR